MMSSLLAHAGSECTYKRGIVSASIVMHKSDLPPMSLELSDGQQVEAIITAFRTKVQNMAQFGNPQKGDRISVNGLNYEVLPINDKCFYTVAEIMHIHTKRVA